MKVTARGSRLAFDWVEPPASVADPSAANLKLPLNQTRPTRRTIRDYRRSSSTGGPAVAGRLALLDRQYGLSRKGRHEAAPNGLGISLWRRVGETTGGPTAEVDCGGGRLARPVHQSSTARHDRFPFPSPSPFPLSLPAFFGRAATGAATGSAAEAGRS